MKTLNLVPGSPEWHEHRTKTYNASEAAAVLGLSRYMTRTDLLKQKATGLAKEVDAGTQHLFNRGHEAEAKARPIIEGMIAEELFPKVGYREIDGLPLSASFDGLTMAENIAVEIKLWNEELSQAVMRGDVPDTHWPQLEHQLLVSEAERNYFAVSDGTPERTIGTWYESRPERRARIIAGWKQFAADLANYQHVDVVAAPVAAPIEALPALFVQLEGRVVSSNLEVFKETALAFIRGINTDLQTDQHFADADQMVKFCKDGEERLETVKAQALAQTASIDELFRTIDTISAELRTKRLELDRLVKARKETIRGDIVQDGRMALAEHISALNARLGKPYMPTISADFAGSVKNKRTIDSLRDAVNTELARAKIEASAIADKIEMNLKHLRETATDYAFLFADAAQIVLKPADDFNLLVKARIDAHKTEEEAKRQREAEAAAKIAAIAQAAPVQAITQQSTAAEVVNAIHNPAQVARPPSPPTMKLGTIAERLGFALPAEFLKTLGFEGTRIKGACLFHESDYPLICDALQRHIEAAKRKAAA